MGAHVGIPTLFRGVNFRSRTEARWAAFFTALGWPWEYEPVDLEGYLPDFIIRWRRPLLVEVKGVSSLDAAEHLARQKLERTSWDGEALIVGSAPGNLRDSLPVIGLHASRETGPDGALEWLWFEGRAFRCLNCGSPSLFSSCESWHCRVCGEGEGNEHQADLPLWDIWAKATNDTQWRAVG